MQAREFLTAMNTAERLKDATRHCYTSGGRRESVAEHSWRMALMALFMADEFPEADMDKVIKMCLIHDLGEAFTGDIPTFEKTQSDEVREEELLAAWLQSLPEPVRDELRTLFAEMDARRSLESRICKAIDKLEAVMQHNESHISTWLPLEYELNLSYGEDAAAFSPWLKELRREIRQDTERKIAENFSQQM